MITVNVHGAMTHLTRLLARVSAGEAVIIGKAGRPVAKLSPYRSPATRRVSGRHAGLFTTPDDFGAPLPEVIGAFEEGA